MQGFFQGAKCKNLIAGFQFTKSSNFFDLKIFDKQHSPKTNIQLL